jgi:hypothetical protein
MVTPERAEHHLKLMIGDLVMKLALQQAQIEALREQIPQPPQPAPPDAQP